MVLSMEELIPDHRLTCYTIIEELILDHLAHGQCQKALITLKLVRKSSLIGPQAKRRT